MAKALEPQNTVYVIYEIDGVQRTKNVVVAESLFVDDAVHVSINNRDSIETAHIPFKIAEEIALDILARLKDRGFYDNT